MSPDPAVVLGMPMFGRVDVLPRTLESLLSQTFRDFALVTVDDSPASGGAAIVEQYVGFGIRVHYEANERRLGMVDNWRKVFERARALYPRSRYFAWVSDHDLWHAQWLEALVGVLETHPAVVLAYPRNMRIMPGSARRTEKVFETFGMTSRSARVRASALRMLAGDMIYGLMRVDALAAAGGFRRVVTPDRQLLLALSLFGQVRQVPVVLWYREVLQSKLDLGRQRRALFPHGVPLYAYLPSHLQHFALAFWDFGLWGRGRPAFGRVEGAWCAVVQLWSSVERDLVRPKVGWRLALRRCLPGWRGSPWLRSP
jgi:glycosyltransferase involved in cell wall biosynthesis